MAVGIYAKLLSPQRAIVPSELRALLVHLWQEKKQFT